MDQKTMEFVASAKSVHGNSYNYSKVVYKNSKTKVEIYCPKHDLVFYQTPGNHINKKCRCPKCGRESGAKLQTKDVNSFIEDAKALHCDTYDYSKSVYVNKYTDLIITCPTHGDFTQTPSAHLRNGSPCGCPQCGFVKIGDRSRSTTEDFIKKSKEMYGNKFNYSKTVYTIDKSPVIIHCNDCNVDFKVIAANHLRRAGGCKCCISIGEKNIRLFLEKNNISFEQQKPFDGCKLQRSLKFDFYLPDFNTCIEFQGSHHYYPENFFGGEEGFKITQNRDKIKSDYCSINNIKLIYLTKDSDINKTLDFLCSK